MFYFKRELVVSFLGVLKYLIGCLVFNLFILNDSLGQIKSPDALLELARQKARATDSLLKQIEDDNTVAAKYILLFFPSTSEGQTLNSDNLALIEKRYRKIKKRHPSVKRVYMITTAGKVWVPPMDANEEYLKVSDPQKIPAYVLASPEKNPKQQTMWTEPYKNDSQGEWLVTCTTPLYQRDISQRDTFLGIQALDIDLGALKDEVLKVKAIKTGLALLVDNKGNFIAQLKLSKTRKEGEEAFPYTNMREIPSESIQNVIQIMSEGKEGVIKFSMGDAIKYFAFTPIKTTGWSYGIITEVLNKRR